MTDGLSKLDQQRAKASKRHVPPPRHAAPPKPEPAPDTTLDSVEPAAEASNQRTAKAPSASTKVPPRTAPRTQSAASAPPAGNALVKATLYLDSAADDLLSEINYIARKQRVDGSRSAVVRLAIERLMQSMSVAEVVDELRARGDGMTSGGLTGRRRV